MKTCGRTGNREAIDEIGSLCFCEQRDQKANKIQTEDQHVGQAHFKHYILYKLIFYPGSSATNEILQVAE